MFGDSVESSEIILIQHDTGWYALWCQHCRSVQPAHPVNDDLRCVVCNWKLGERMPDDYIQHLMEKGLIQ